MATKKRSRPFEGSSSTKGISKKSGNARPLCSFCQHTPAAVLLELSHLGKKQETAFCLLHYYTTSAVRVNEENVKMIDETLVEEQLKDGMIQDIFAQAYTELQQDFASEAAARAVQGQQTGDPLAVLRSLHGRPKKKPPQLTTKSPSDYDNAGGFINTFSLPERLLKSRSEQHQPQGNEVGGFQNPQQLAHKSNPYGRRKPSRKSIWSMALDPTVTGSSESLSTFESITCSCGSKKVQPLGNVTSRNQDLAKGETWGTKDRSDDVVGRYQCQECGKVWTQES